MKKQTKCINYWMILVFYKVIFIYIYIFSDSERTSESSLLTPVNGNPFPAVSIYATTPSMSGQLSESLQTLSSLDNITIPHLATGRNPHSPQQVFHSHLEDGEKETQFRGSKSNEDVTETEMIFEHPDFDLQMDAVDDVTSVTRMIGAQVHSGSSRPRGNSRARMGESTEFHIKQTRHITTKNSGIPASISRPRVFPPLTHTGSFRSTASEETSFICIQEACSDPQIHPDSGSDEEVSALTRDLSESMPVLPKFVQNSDLYQISGDGFKDSVPPESSMKFGGKPEEEEEEEEFPQVSQSSLPYLGIGSHDSVAESTPDISDTESLMASEEFQPLDSETIMQPKCEPSPLVIDIHVPMKTVNESTAVWTQINQDVVEVNTESTSQVSQSNQTGTESGIIFESTSEMLQANTNGTESRITPESTLVDLQSNQNGTESKTIPESTPDVSQSNQNGTESEMIPEPTQMVPQSNGCESMIIHESTPALSQSDHNGTESGIIPESTPDVSQSNQNSIESKTILESTPVKLHPNQNSTESKIILESIPALSKSRPDVLQSKQNGTESRTIRKSTTDNSQSNQNGTESRIICESTPKVSQSNHNGTESRIIPESTPDVLQSNKNGTESKIIGESTPKVSQSNHNGTESRIIPESTPVLTHSNKNYTESRIIPESTTEVSHSGQNGTESRIIPESTPKVSHSGQSGTESTSDTSQSTHIGTESGIMPVLISEVSQSKMNGTESRINPESTPKVSQSNQNGTESRMIPDRDLLAEGTDTNRDSGFYAEGTRTRPDYDDQWHTGSSEQNAVILEKSPLRSNRSSATSSRLFHESASHFYCFCSSLDDGMYFPQDVASMKLLAQECGAGRAADRNQLSSMLQGCKEQGMEPQFILDILYTRRRHDRLARGFLHLIPRTVLEDLIKHGEKDSWWPCF